MADEIETEKQTAWDKLRRLVSSWEFAARPAEPIAGRYVHRVDVGRTFPFTIRMDATEFPSFKDNTIFVPSAPPRDVYRWYSLGELIPEE